MGGQTLKGYLVIDVDYGDSSIRQAATIAYWRDDAGKRFEQMPEDLELVRVPYANKVQWVIMSKWAVLDGEEVTDAGFHMVAGQARSRNLGGQENREAAATLKGQGLADSTQDGQRTIEMSTPSLTLYPAWTYWANAQNQGNQDFNATVQMIKDYLTGKGYTEDVD